jgi:GntR family transcriptional regulator/MocR family aminotransferase
MSRATVHHALLSINVSRQAVAPISHQVFLQIKELISRGRLSDGARLPSTRDLATELGVSRNAIVSAYEELRAGNYIFARAGAGSFVAGVRRRVPVSTQSASSGAGRYSPVPEPGFLIGQPFEIDVPAIDVFPHRLWSRIAANRFASDLRSLFCSAEAGGYAPLQQVIAEHLRETRAIACSPDQVVVVTGQGQAVSLAAGLLVRPGDKVMVEDPSRLGIRHILSRAGARLIHAPVDAAGMNPMAAGVAVDEARFALVTPSSHFPLGVALDDARRAALAEWALERDDRWILEDDTGHDLASPSSWRVPLWSHAPERVVYFSSFRPTLAPSLRLGYMVVPERLIGAFHQARLAADGYRPPMEQAILTDFMSGGHYAKHVRAMRVTYAERAVALASAVEENLHGLVLGEPQPADLHTICRLAAAFRDTEIAARAAGHFVLRPLSSFHEATPAGNALLLGHAPMNVAEIRRRVRALARVLRPA